MAKKNLGRGLGDLLGEIEEAYQKDLNDSSGLVIEIDIDKIKPNPFQPRKVFDDNSLLELSNSIIEHGLLQPVLVYEDSKNPNFYYLIAGERRLKASKIANKDSIKAIIVDIQENKIRELALIENIQRENLNPIDLAHSYQELISDYNITHDELATRLAKSRTQITNTMRLLNLNKKIQDYIVEGKITQGHAKILVTLDEKEQLKVADSVVGQKLSVHECEKLVRDIKNGHNKKGNTTNKIKNDNSKIVKICEKLCDANIKASHKNNKIIVEFRNDDEIEKFNKMFIF
ncbi:MULTISPECIES: ParB/RepB/Spo0J family partition protein [Helicobacter]|uniref:ParB/RepB/Spo0J family partition protein n=1 Tax=Helicobacter ibis TaxID=2962633 RepID=A0ABT4VD26_9HELI|nr:MULTISPECIES: ParB/RepB/Spo0J family partition protein [Helicobacter]MDA3967319.1 ParB/RepB/Spo0J family partition protein [Helicobacter sp. WB40]MDA3968612.1 ParB/RepB/Spo0J family partition protein [Helicobacter ibis]